MSTMRTRKKVFICNLLIVLLSLVSIFSYFVLPFWKVDLSYTLTAETIEKVLPSLQDDSENTEDSEVNVDDIYEKIDFNELVGEEGITLKLTIALESQDILSALNSDPTPLVESILNKNVETLVSQMDGLIDEVVHKLLTTVAKVTVKETIKQQIKNQIGEDADDAQVQEELEKLGLNDTYVDEKMDTLIDALYQENATPESAADTAIEVVEDVVAQMKENGGEDYKDVELSEEDKEELKNTLIENLGKFTDENGKLNIDDFATDFLVGILTGNTESTPEIPDLGSSDSSVSAKNTSKIILLSDSSSSEQSETEAAQELHDLLTEKLMAELTPHVDTIADVLTYISYIIIFTFFTWAYLILKILVKMNMKNNAIKLKLPIWFGSLPFVVLCLIPTVLFTALKNPPAALTNLIPMLDSLTSGFNISFFSCSMVSFIIGTFFVFFSIFYYGRLRRKLKKMKKTAIIEPDYNLNDNDVEIAPRQPAVAAADATEQKEPSNK